MAEIEVIPASKDDWVRIIGAAKFSSAYASRAICELRQRIQALEAAAPVPGPAIGLTVDELCSMVAQIYAERSDGGFKRVATAMLQHPRLGPLLRGEGTAATPAPVRVELPKDPPVYLLSLQSDFTVKRIRATWHVARTEVKRQQEGQANG